MGPLPSPLYAGPPYALWLGLARGTRGRGRGAKGLVALLLRADRTNGAQQRAVAGPEAQKNPPTTIPLVRWVPRHSVLQKADCSDRCPAQRPFPGLLPSPPHA